MGRFSRMSLALVAVTVVAAACSESVTDPVPELPQVTTVAEVACGPGAGVDDLLIPECGVLWGTVDALEDGSVPLSLEHQERTVAQSAGAGEPYSFGLVRVYQRGGGDVGAVVRDRLSGMPEGQILYFSWKVATGAGAWAEIAAGSHDEVLQEFATAVAEAGRPIFVSLHHEPEGDGEGTPDEYRAMWEHAQSVVESELDASSGTGDVVWVMNYQGHVSGENLEQVDAYYPGGEVIDWLSYNPYNWAECRNGARWRSFVDVASPLYRYLTSQPQFAGADGNPKPLLIGETASNEDPGDDGRKADWIRDMADALEGGKLPEVKAVVWFNQAAPRFCDRYWYTSDSATDAFAEASVRPFFNPAAPQ